MERAKMKSLTDGAEALLLPLLSHKGFCSFLASALIQKFSHKAARN